ncbi:hypothetical protein BKA69DRAFT_1080447 [Paraphysoderma sedebokerense]|nr:hypothetical protein BKA69DRAFT_1080447 [Paraphysoderma sedebokerense]
MKAPIVAVLSCLLLGIVNAIPTGIESFAGHQVLRFNVKSKSEIKKLTEVVEKYNLDTWSSISIGQTDIRVPPSALSDVKALPIEHSTFIPDLGELVAEERTLNQLSADDFFTGYHKFEEIETYMQDLLTAYPKLVTKVEIGQTFEGATIWGLKVTGTGNGPKKGFVMHGGIHAREWITVASVTYTLNELVTQYGKDAEITALMDYFSFTIIPVLNIDGYKYTWNGSRMWRKNRQPQGNCIGTDANRNFDYQWGAGGSSSNPCSDTYRGPTAGSALETAAIQNFVKKEAPVAYIDVHAYSQLWMYPFGYSCRASSSDAKVQQQGAEKAVAALKAVNGLSFKAGDICNTIYQASGSSVDYMYAEAKVKYSYAVELRDTGRYGFVIPPNQIKYAFQSYDIFLELLILDD